MEGRTRSSNWRAWASAFLGLLAAAALPVALALSQWRKLFALLHSWPAIPIAAGLGLLAVLLARSARRRSEWTLGRVGGTRVARIGRALGVGGIYLAGTAAISLLVYWLLNRYSA